MIFYQQIETIQYYLELIRSLIKYFNKRHKLKTKD